MESRGYTVGNPARMAEGKVVTAFLDVIRNEQDYRETWEYIDGNPARWLEKHSLPGMMNISLFRLRNGQRKLVWKTFRGMCSLSYQHAVFHTTPPLLRKTYQKQKLPERRTFRGV